MGKRINSGSSDNGRNDEDRPTWANDGFLNFDVALKVKNKEGTVELVWVKLGAAGLKNSVEVQRTIREFCAKDEGNAQKLLDSGRLRVNYRSATPEKKHFEIDLGEKAA